MVVSRNTKQKQVIEQEIGSFTSFFDAEQLYEKASKKNNKIGIATVYRSLKTLVDEGKLHSYSCNRKMLYSTSKKSHCHFTCEKCKQTVHIDVKKLDFLKKEIAGDICHFQLDVTGVCEKCSTKKGH